MCRFNQREEKKNNQTAKNLVLFIRTSAHNHNLNFVSFSFVFFTVFSSTNNVNFEWNRKIRTTMNKIPTTSNKEKQNIKIDKKIHSLKKKKRREQARERDMHREMKIKRMLKSTYAHPIYMYNKSIHNI